MSASEQTKKEAESGPEEDKARRPGGQTLGGVFETPLFLRGGNEGRKDDAQDEKDESGE